MNPKVDVFLSKTQKWQVEFEKLSFNVQRRSEQHQA